MKDSILYFGMVTVFILLVMGIALYAWSNFHTLGGNFDLVGVAGLFILYILLGKDPSLELKRIGIEPSTENPFVPGDM